MKRIVFAIFACLLLLTACQSTGASSSSSETSSESSQIESTSSVGSPENSSAASSIGSSSAVPPAVSGTENKLSTAVHMIIPEDNPTAYEASEKRNEAGTAEELEFYMKWIANLKASDVKSICGYVAPYFEYSQGDMSLSDSQKLFDKLKAISPTVLPADASPNPNTGGIMAVSIRTKTEHVIISFNGGWFMISFDSEKPTLRFDANEKAVNESCAEIWQMLEDNMNNNAGKQPDPMYKKSKVESLYAANTSSYVMAKIPNSSASREILSLLEKYRSNELSTEPLAYLVFTEQGKEYVYLDDTTPSLSDDCREALSGSPLHPSWLIHMTPRRIESANGVTDKKKLLELAAFLKENVTVNAATEQLDGQPSPSGVAGSYTLKIKFDSGVTYSIVGYDYADGTGDFSIHTDDLNKTIDYKCDKDVSQKLRVYIEQLK